MDSEDEEGASPAPPILLRALSTDNETGSSDAEPLSLSEGSLESPTPTTPRRQDKGAECDDDRTSMVKCIVNSVVDSEAVYVECLSVMLQVQLFFPHVYRPAATTIVNNFHFYFTVHESDQSDTDDVTASNF